MAFYVLYLLCFIFFVFVPCSTVAQTYRNISLGSSLTALNDNSSCWLSPSGEFAFGFREVKKHGFLLAIWFNKIPERTIVWSANGKNLVPHGSIVGLTTDGQLLLNDIATGKEISVASSAASGVVYAAMLDTGNFVLANTISTNLWQSFDQPTDTILPTQTFNHGYTLFARYSPTNYSRGRFLLTLQSDGNLVLYTTNFPQDYPYFAYWNTNTTGDGFQVIFNRSGSLYLTARNGTILKVSAYTISKEDLYQRATLDYDGVLRHYLYHKSNGSSIGAWSTSSFIPSNICMSIMQPKGGGACGFNSLCKNDHGRPTCQCPSGYALVDPNDVFKGCKQNFVSQSCDEALAETVADLFDLHEMQSAVWYGSEYEKFQAVTEDWCRQTCLADFFCAVASFRNGNCWLNGVPLLNGRIDTSYNGKALIKIRKGNSTLGSASKDANTKRKESSTLIVVGSVLLSSLGFLNFLLPLITYLVVSRFYSRKATVIQPYPVLGLNLKCFNYEELKNATKEFKEELGRGASATVFKGVLVFDNGIEKCVAVKSLDAKVRENDLEFKAEVSAIGRTNHRNLVQLLGFCNEGQHRILVYDFMSNGSLAGFLFGESRPNWNRRRQIALGISRGLLYLHEECSSQIIHCDIKPQNILLDDAFTARISDFGLAKLLRMDQTRTTTGIRGTKGYVAPEWFKNLPVTVKVDVYSFGILLLEIICCRKKLEVDAQDEDQMILADWAYDCYKQNKLHLLLQNDGEAVEDIKEMKKYVMIAIWCIKEDPSLRPTMKKVTLMLEGTLEVSIPADQLTFMNSTV